MQYHGTTIESAIELLTDGCKDRAIWNCSEANDLYVWDGEETYICENGCIDGYTDEIAIQNAFSSGRTALAFSEVPQTIGVVLEFDFPSDVLERDYSCYGMEETGAMVVEMNLGYLPYLKSIKYVKHNSRLDIFMISSLLGNKYFNDYLIDDETRRIAESTDSSPLYDNIEYEFEYETITIESTQTFESITKILKRL